MIAAVTFSISPARPEWAHEFRTLAGQLALARGIDVVAIDHIGSTAVPGLPAKDVIDAQVIVRALDDSSRILSALADIGFVQRPGDWNLRDHIPAGWDGDPAEWDKLVVSPPDGQRPSNIHIRAAGKANERYALLFRDYLRSNPAARLAWGDFKTRLATVTTSRESYGQVKDPVTDVLLVAAEEWAAATDWSVVSAREAI